MTDRNIAVKLAVVEDSGRRIDTAPEEAAIGALRLLPWQIHPVKKAADDFAGAAVYLVKVSYELELEQDLPPIRWYELGLEFGEDASATVVDAVPRTSRVPRPAAAYDLTRYLEFAPAGKSGQVHLSETNGAVYRHGVPGSSVRWRHASEHRDGIEPGSRSGWLALVVPDGCERLPITLSARFDLQAGADSPYWPVQEPVRFDLTLRDEQFKPPLTPAVPDGRRAFDPGEPSAFICYAHDDAEHKENVRRFADVLLAEGIDVHIDQYADVRRKDWGHWAYRNLRNRDFVLVIASPMCRAVGDGDAALEKHPGLRAEFDALRTLHQRNPEWRPYVLPVVLPGRSEYEIPLFLGPGPNDYYRIADYAPECVANLLLVMRSTERRTWSLS
ncbi:toll/interleukin-1 receptor domain-containing protein [Amycolatopsis nivea]|uniref:toll/interleukin-1 receptor domain-containing protein n=1 Tax=Amycolatopsis nivea TaxID=1644109 RepID=UPI00106F702A|nr:toll/interleukin-1 receptor domain-containing protein [Amycolatopsis nivea]